MKLIKNNNINLQFLVCRGKHWWLLLLMVFSLNSFAQIHVSDNTVFIVKENTTIYIADGTSESTSVNVKKNNHRAKRKTIVKKAKKRSYSLPMAKKDTETGNRVRVLSFNSKPKAPSALFYSVKGTKAALVQSGSFGVKSFPPKKAYNNTIHIFLPNVDSQIKTSFAGTLPKQQTHLEEHITRPPPFQIWRFPDLTSKINFTFR